MEHSFESIEKSLNTAFEKGLISEELLEKSLEELDLIKGSNDPTHGGKLKPKHIINKQGRKQLVYVLPEEVTSEHLPLKAGDKFKTKNGEEHDFVKDKGHDNKGGHLVTLKDKTGRIHDKYIHNLESVDGVSEQTNNNIKPTSEDKQMSAQEASKDQDKQKSEGVEKKDEEEISWKDVVRSNGAIFEAKINGDKVTIHHTFYPKVPRGMIGYSVKVNGETDVDFHRTAKDDGVESINVVAKLKKDIIDSYTKKKEVEKSTKDSDISIPSVANFSSAKEFWNKLDGKQQLHLMKTRILNHLPESHFQSFKAEHTPYNWYPKEFQHDIDNDFENEKMKLAGLI